MIVIYAISKEFVVIDPYFRMICIINSMVSSAIWD